MSSSIRHRLTVDGPILANLLHLEGRGLHRLCPLCQGEQKKAEIQRKRIRELELEMEKDMKSWAGKTIEPMADEPCYTFDISPQSFTCTSCGIYGDLVDMVRLCNHCDEEEALLWLARNQAIEGGEATLDQAIGFDDRVSDAYANTYQAFLDLSRPLPEKVYAVLRQWSITPDDAAYFGLRYYARDYRKAMSDLFDLFDVDTLTGAGLMCKDRSPEDSGDSGWFDLSRRGCFRIYAEKQVPYLVIPYMLDCKVVHLKAQPLIAPERLEQLGVPGILGTGDVAPLPFNADVLREHDHIVVTRGELNAMGVEALGYPAIALGSFNNPDAGWFEHFKGKRLIFVLSPRAQQDPRAGELFRKMIEYGLPQPRVVTMPPVKQLQSLLEVEFGAPPVAEVLNGLEA